MGFKKSKRGLSNAVSTLIVLVISVLLATVVTYYAINITSARIEEECIQVTKTNVWANGTQAVAATVIKNVGGRDVVIDMLAVRSIESDWNKTYYWFANEQITDDVEYHYWDNATKLTGAYVELVVQGSNRTFKRASTDLILPSGGTLVVYIRDPDSIGINDIGTPVSVTVHTVQAKHIEETNVKAGQ